MKKKITALLMAAIMVLSLFAGCAADNGKSDVTNNNGIVDNKDTSGTDTGNGSEDKKDDYVLNVGTIKGPTGMGMAKVISDNEQSNKYSFNIFNEASEISGKLLGKQLDIAAVPVNLAAIVNKNTEGAYLIAAINTLGVLYIVENGNTVNSVADLAGKTIHAYGQKATPEYMLSYILEKNGIKDSVTIQWYSDPATLSAQAVQGNADIIMLPEPQITASLTKNAELRIALDITAEWDKVSDQKAVQGCIVVKKETAEQHPDAVKAFLGDYKASVEFVNTNTEEASAMIAKLGIVPAAPIASKAIPRCNIVFIDGDEMVSALNSFYAVLFAANPASVGGKLPDDSIYYKK